jgi:hypothetical protein
MSVSTFKIADNLCISPILIQISKHGNFHHAAQWNVKIKKKDDYFRISQAQIITVHIIRDCLDFIDVLFVMYILNDGMLAYTKC